MKDMLSTLTERLEAERTDAQARARRMSHAYRCRCGNDMFFDNTLCLACKSALGLSAGYRPSRALEAGPEHGTWHARGARSS